MSSTDKAKLDGIASGANNYSLPTASANTLGGIKTGYNNTADAKKWAVKVDNNGNAFVPISGLYHGVDNCVSSLIIGSSNTTSFNGSSIVFSSQGHGDYSCDFPKRGGTFALTSDLSDVCKFNFITNISECKNGKINFLYRNNNDHIDLNFLDNLQDGVILFIVSYTYGRYVSHTSSEWVHNNYETGTDYSYIATLSTGRVYLATKYNGKVHLFSLFKE